jgi:hypothetical protein
MYHIYIIIIIPLLPPHSTPSITTYYYYTIYHHHHWKKYFFFVKLWIKLHKYYQISSLSITFLRVFLLLLSNIYLVLPISITIYVNNCYYDIDVYKLKTMFPSSLTWIITIKFNLIVNLLNKVYLNLSLWQSPSLYYCQSQCQSQPLSKSMSITTTVKVNVNHNYCRNHCYHPKMNLNHNHLHLFITIISSSPSSSTIINQYYPLISNY